MTCKPKVVKWDEVEAKEVPENMATKTTIRWLIGPGEAPTFYMRVFEVQPGGEIFEHSHPWEHEIFVLKGKGIIRINGKEYEVEEGSVVYIPPCAEHYYKNTGDEVLRFICVIPKEGAQK
jgi:quercetin dioxygenase-like cupin family protein